MSALANEKRRCLGKGKTERSCSRASLYVHVCVRVCVCVRICECVRVGLCMCRCVCVLSESASRSTLERRGQKGKQERARPRIATRVHLVGCDEDLERAQPERQVFFHPNLRREANTRVKDFISEENQNKGLKFDQKRSVERSVRDANGKSPFA
jgi:hypothetical protein